MCIIVSKPEGVELPESTLNECFAHNSDGAGFMYAEDNTLAIKKGYFTFEKFMEEYTPHAKKAATLHFRIRTHGALNGEMCHPFEVEWGLAFAHNGILSHIPWDTEKSDTYIFNESILKPLIEKHGAEVLQDIVIQKLISNFIGNDKLVFMDYTGQRTIINEKLGNEALDCWFSNMSYKERPKSTYQGNYYKRQRWENGKWVPHDKEKEDADEQAVSSTNGAALTHYRGTPQNQPYQNVLSLPKKDKSSSLDRRLFEKDDIKDVEIVRDDTGTVVKRSLITKTGEIGTKRGVWNAHLMSWEVVREGNDTIINTGDVIEFTRHVKDNYGCIVFMEGEIAEVTGFGEGFGVWVKSFEPRMQDPERCVPLYSVKKYWGKEEELNNAIPAI